jgi:bacteriorhodopsin
MLELESLSIGQYGFIGNVFSFGLAVMAATTLFMWLMRSSVAPAYRMALTVTGLVTAIAGYHYLQIMLSWDASASALTGDVVATGEGFNRAYRYVDWLLTVPLLLIELLLVMKLSKSDFMSRSVKLGGAAALMIILGYPGEVSEEVGTRALFWILAMIPFLYIVRELVVGLKESVERQPEEVKGLLTGAAYLLVASWAFYPIVYLLPLVGVSGGSAIVAVETGYTIADIVSKCVFGVLIYMIAVRKSHADGFENKDGFAQSATEEQKTPAKKGALTQS